MLTCSQIQSWTELRNLELTCQGGHLKWISPNAFPYLQTLHLRCYTSIYAEAKPSTALSFLERDTFPNLKSVKLECDGHYSSHCSWPEALLDFLPDFCARHRASLSTLCLPRSGYEVIILHLPQLETIISAITASHIDTLHISAKMCPMGKWPQTALLNIRDLRILDHKAERKLVAPRYYRIVGNSLEDDQWMEVQDLDPRILPCEPKFLPPTKPFWPNAPNLRVLRVRPEAADTFLLEGLPEQYPKLEELYIDLKDVVSSLSPTLCGIGLTSWCIDWAG